MLFAKPLAVRNALRGAIDAAYLADETQCVEALLPQATLDGDAAQRVADLARRLVATVRERRTTQGGLDAFMGEYDLASQEGVVLMCLAEALLRIPDATTADRLIRDKLAHGDWEKHLGHSPSLFVNASTWGLMLTGRIVRLDREVVNDVASFLARLVARSGEPAIRLALREAMRIMAHQFVMGRTIEEAIARSQGSEHAAYRYSFDMLGEAALSSADAARYQQAYACAIDVIARTTRHSGDVFSAPGVSVKLSALHPRFELAQRERVVAELVPRVEDLAHQAMAAGLCLTVDAEEADRLEPTLDVFEAVFRSPGLKGWEGLGLAVQAYQKRAVPVLDWLAALARAHKRRIMLRLVKGAYWDSEIKRAQERGLDGYPVFTRKAATDVSYLACAQRVLAAHDAFYPQFATHNAHSVAAVVEMAGADRGFEFQRLHGMGEVLFEQISDPDGLAIPCRVYGPVGSHAELLPYLVRRLLENGANTSFVNRIVDEQVPVEEIIADPAARLRALEHKPHPRIPLPIDLFGQERRNARGINLNDPAALAALAQSMDQAAARDWSAAPLVGGKTLGGAVREVRNPADHRDVVGRVREADAAAVEEALTAAVAAAPDWDRLGAERRAACLERAADRLEAHRAELMSLCVREAGRCVPDALAEVREAVDYCRYYAVQARRDFGAPQSLPGPTGESNALALHGRGVFACISPWNFPLAIFTGQVAAALAAGNAVIAKPAGQTPLVAARAVRLLHEAGVPAEVLHLLPGKGSEVGAALIADARVAGVAFIGSTETARAINRQLAARPGPIVPLVAETGGQNAMLVDSSALPEQVVADALQSAFNSAGQRCSALRVLFVQEDIAPRIIELLQGAMAELSMGDPALLATDVGPVIDNAAREALMGHIERMAREGKIIQRVPLPDAAARGSYVVPHAFEIDRLSQLTGEVFGPVLHVIRYPADALDQVIADINATGYGLTLGIHSRVEASARYIQQRVRAGNVYVNRNMIGAVVGVQPFGGEGLSGTGPKAGGPFYLHRFASERAVTVNTAAAGGNAALLSVEDDSGA